MDRIRASAIWAIFLISLGAVVASAAGCLTVHYYDGTVAELEPAPGLAVALTASEYGDCFRSDREVPIVYAVERPNYSLRIAHGMRYWPEFFLIARDSKGAVLDISGEHIQPVRAPRGGDMRRLREARQSDFSYVVYLLVDLPPLYDGRDGSRPLVDAVRNGAVGVRTLAFDIRDSDSRVIGEEQFRYRINVIECRAVDGP